MLVLGIGHDLVLSSAALVADGQVVAAVAEERLNRQKLFKGFPELAIKECLGMAGIGFDDLDSVAVGWNPSRHMEFPNRRQSANARWGGEYLYSLPNLLGGAFGHGSSDNLSQEFPSLGVPIEYLDHALCHVGTAFYLADLDRAEVFTADGRGERSTTTWGTISRQEGYHKLGEVYWPHSLGLMYGSVTQHLGFRPDSDEWKVMALASYSDSEEFVDAMRALVVIEPEGCSFTIDQAAFSFGHPEVYGGRFTTPVFERAFGPPRRSDEPLTAQHYAIAHALQRVFEETMTRLVTELHRQTGEEALVAAGGCFMNSVFNGKVTSQTPFGQYFLPSCPDDSGIAVGAALVAYHRHCDEPRFGVHAHNYWGPAFDHQVQETLQRYKLSYEKLDDPPVRAAELLAGGALLGWFQGPMEFGQRALGNRSILADPRRVEVKDEVNAAVKYREGFRPFAPAILADRVDEYFHADADASVPFMERVYQFRHEVIDRVPGVVHADGSGRLQTVEREHNPRFFDLISHFEKLSGVPIVLNTSFNLNGEPIVCTPTDALRTFFSCGLDALIMGDFSVTKSAQPS